MILHRIHDPIPPNIKSTQDVDYFPSLQGDLKGGAAAALPTIPLAIGFGLFAFAPLGDRFSQVAIFAALYGAIIVPIVALILRANSSVVLAAKGISLQEFHFLPTKEWVAIGAIGAIEPQSYTLLLGKCGIGDPAGGISGPCQKR